MKSTTAIDLKFSNLHIDPDKKIVIEVLVETDAYYQALYLHFLLIKPKYIDDQNPLSTSNY